MKASYFVTYEGTPENPDDFLRYYLEVHVPIIWTWPEVRSVEVHRGVDGGDFFMVAEFGFDSISDLRGALESAGRQAAREDRDNFPPFHGTIRHQAIETIQTKPRGDSANPPRGWRTRREAMRIVRSRLPRTISLAVLVGTLVFCVNQLDVLLRDGVQPNTYLKAAITYLLPFCVANLGILSASRALEDPRRTPDPTSDAAAFAGFPRVQVLAVGTEASAQ